MGENRLPKGRLSTVFIAYKTREDEKTGGGVAKQPPGERSSGCGLQAHHRAPGVSGWDMMTVGRPLNARPDT